MFWVYEILDLGLVDGFFLEWRLSQTKALEIMSGIVPGLASC
jgi:hypothetical protein